MASLRRRFLPLRRGEYSRCVPSGPPLMAEGAVYATSTRLAACVLENPAVPVDALRSLATMVDLDHDPRLIPSDAPSIAEIRRRAAALLRGHR